MMTNETIKMMEDMDNDNGIFTVAIELLNEKFPDVHDFGGVGDGDGFSFDFQPNESMGKYQVSMQIGHGYINVYSVDTSKDWEEKNKRYPDKKEYEYTNQEEYNKKVKTAISYLKRLEKKYSRD